MFDHYFKLGALAGYANSLKTGIELDEDVIPLVTPLQVKFQY